MALATGLLRMVPSDPAVTVASIRLFLKLHISCGGLSIDTPDVPGGTGYRAVLACRCGDTAEYWGHDALLARQQLLTTVSNRRVA